MKISPHIGPTRPYFVFGCIMGFCGGFMAAIAFLAVTLH